MSAKWIWYPGDMELYHGMLQNFAREERGYGWPAYWRMDDWRKNVIFRRTVSLPRKTSFTVYGCGTGHVKICDRKYPLRTEIRLEAGEYVIEVFIGNMTGLPCIFIDAPGLCTDESWTADDFTEEHHAGVSPLFTEASQDPNGVPYVCTEHAPGEVTASDDGLLFDFGRVIDGTLLVSLTGERSEVTLCYGESAAEAMDVQWCYYSQEHVTQDTEVRRRAFRYVFLPGVREGEAELIARHMQVPIARRASFDTDDETLSRIWEVAAETFSLCSGLFFIDGVKRDRWIWAGDAYQSCFVNAYLFGDPEIEERTARALRGNTLIVQHLNTIVDYSMLWLIGLWQHYERYGSLDFLREMYEKARAMIDLFESQRDENGFIVGRERDWIYIDWADIEKDGPVCAEQILLWNSYLTMAQITETLDMDATRFLEEAYKLKRAVIRHFWDEERGGFVDCVGSSKITRHANILALHTNFAKKGTEMAETIVKNVLLSRELPAITTPYFKFFELDVLAAYGELDAVMDQIRSYWGGMLDLGATTFWEQYDPKASSDEHFCMYGDPFGKSLCHAWAASPIYLLGRYFLGVRPTSVGCETFEVRPKTAYFPSLHATVPVGAGQVRIDFEDGTLTVTADRPGGVLILDGSETEIPVSE